MCSGVPPARCRCSSHIHLTPTCWYGNRRSYICAGMLNPPSMFTTADSPSTPRPCASAEVPGALTPASSAPSSTAARTFSLPAAPPRRAAAATRHSYQSESAHQTSVQPNLETASGKKHQRDAATPQRCPRSCLSCLPAPDLLPTENTRAPGALQCAGKVWGPGGQTSIVIVISTGQAVIATAAVAGN